MPIEVRKMFFHIICLKIHEWKHHIFQMTICLLVNRKLAGLNSINICTNHFYNAAYIFYIDLALNKGSDRLFYIKWELSLSFTLFQCEAITLAQNLKDYSLLIVWLIFYNQTEATYKKSFCTFSFNLNMFVYLSFEIFIIEENIFSYVSMLLES